MQPFKKYIFRRPLIHVLIFVNMYILSQYINVQIGTDISNVFLMVK